MLIPLLLLVSPAVPATSLSPDAQKDPPVQVSYNDGGRYVYGDRARVYVRPAEDGFLIVLRSDDRGNIRVLSPLDPDDDQQVKGGKKYEAKGRGDREAFVVEDTSGQGTVLAAWSRTPFDVRRYERNGHWDLQALNDSVGRVQADDAETRLQAIVDAVTPSGGHYEYDAAKYVVYSPQYVRAGYGYPYPYGWAGGWWGFDPWWGRPYFGTRVLVERGPFGFRRHW